MADKRRFNGEERRQEAEIYYEESGILARLIEFERLEVSQDDSAEILNQEGRENIDGKPFNQPTVSRILKRARERPVAT